MKLLTGLSQPYAFAYSYKKHHWNFI